MSRTSVSATGVSCFNTKLSFMRRLTVSLFHVRETEDGKKSLTNKLKYFTEQINHWLYDSPSWKYYLSGQTVFYLNTFQRIILLLEKPIIKYCMSRLELIPLLKCLSIQLNIFLPTCRSLTQFLLLNYYNYFLSFTCGRSGSIELVVNSQNTITLSVTALRTPSLILLWILLLVLVVALSFQ